MEEAPIPLEYGLIVSAFNHSPTLRGAASLLQMDPSGLVRKAQRAAKDYGLLQKVGGRWRVTDRGQRLNAWYDESVARQKLALNEESVVRIAAFAWLAEQHLIPGSAKLTAAFGDRHAWSFRILSADLERELIQSRSDFAVNGHAPNDPLVAHRRLSVLPWATIVPGGWAKEWRALRGESARRKFLNARPFVRLGTLPPSQVLGFDPETVARLTVDGVIGVRTAVLSGLGWGCVPAMSISAPEMKSRLCRLEIPTFVKDEVSLWWLRSRRDLSPMLPTLTNWLNQMVKASSV